MVISRPELFLIPHETIMALSLEEVSATYNDMTKLDIARLPYSKTDIGVAYGNYFPEWLVEQSLNKHGLSNNDLEMRLRFENETLIDVLIKSQRTDKLISMWQLHDERFRDERYPKEAIERTAEMFRRVLIVLLATKNALKKRVTNKLAQLGIGKKKHEHLYTTTITIPPIESLSPNPNARPGITLRPHLRRGHIRRQRWGPKRAFIKKVWIEPCFINADPDFISSRTAYNTSVTFPLELA